MIFRNYKLLVYFLETRLLFTIFHSDQAMIAKIMFSIRIGAFEFEKKQAF